jgi:tRNA A37 threonylcarbamoyladenosine dehydratase
MNAFLQRTELLIKEKGLEKLQKANILIVGIGGVGSYAAEALVRAGIVNLTIVDGDTIDATNINRQLLALNSTIGKSKTEVLKERLLDINPDLNLTCIQEFQNPDKIVDLIDPKYDWILDCIDSIQPKVNMLVAAKRKHIKIVSAMGAGGKMDASKVKVTDIHNTRECLLARKIRKELRKRGIQKGIRAVYSTEIQNTESLALTDGADYKRSYYGTISYMPAIFGMFAAAEVIKYLLKKE